MTTRPHAPTPVQTRAIRTHATPFSFRRLLTGLVLLTGCVLCAHANDERDKAEAEKKAMSAKVTTEQLKKTIENSKGKIKTVQLMMGDGGKKSTEGKPSGAAANGEAPVIVRRKPITTATATSMAAPKVAPIIHELGNPVDVRDAGDAGDAGGAQYAPNSRQYIRSRASTLAGHPIAAESMMAGAGGAMAHSDGHNEVHWAYEGEGGPQAWGTLKPEFSTCATGKRQSPINIEDSATLQGPAEPLVMDYRPSNATVINTGHTIQIDVERGNTLTVRGATFELLQFHFHHPAEERVNHKGFAMVAHLVHKNAEGQLAVIGVLIDPGAMSTLINKVWTYMPLEAGDKVRMPLGLLDLNELLPKDMRYYQFMGSLTTPPCSEGVLWMVLKQPVTASNEQIRLFTQMFPNNARPVQPSNGRLIRDAQ